MADNPPERPASDATPRIAFLGPEGTFTDQAAAAAGPDFQRVPFPSIVEVIDAVRHGRCELGIVPIENSIEGSVTTTVDELAFGEGGVAIRAELNIPIALHLVAAPGTALDTVKVVRSHPQALGQVRGWLAAHLPTVGVEPVASTAEAARQAAEGEGVAAVGSLIAAERHTLTVLASQIQDYHGNETRFAVLGRRLTPPSGADKTSIVVFMGPDRPGQLLRILDEFASRGINLTKIESRPTKQRLGEYCIFIDCAGHMTEPRVADALRALHRHVEGLRLLGSYGRADQLRDDPAEADSEAAYAQAARWYDAMAALIDKNPY